MGVKERRERERSQRRSLILKSAQKVFCQKGFLNTSIEDIADKAELSVGTIYLYFKSKEELYVSLLLESFNIFTTRIKDIMDLDLRADKKIKKIWDFFLEFYKKFPEHYMIILFLNNKGITPYISKEVLDNLNRKSGTNFELVSNIIDECIEQGIYKRQNPREVVDVLWSLFIGLVQLMETRANLNLEIVNLQNLHQKAFELIEEGLLKG